MNDWKRTKCSYAGGGVTGSRVSELEDTAAVESDVAMALGAAGEGIGAASKIIHNTHNAIKSDLEKPKKTISTTGEP